MVDAYKAQSLASKSCYFKKRPIKKTIVTQLYINPPLIHGFAFWGFIYPRSTLVQKYEMESSRNKQFLSLNFMVFWVSVMKSHTFPNLPIKDMSHHFVQHITPLVT